MMTSIAVLALVALVYCAALVAWLRWKYSPDRVMCRDGMILLKSQRKKLELPVAQLAAIKFHYHAVVGFAGAWEFVARSGETLRVDAQARGLDQLLVQLEGSLSGFSLEEFRRQFAAGEVEDSLDVWRAA